MKKTRRKKQELIEEEKAEIYCYFIWDDVVVEPTTTMIGTRRSYDQSQIVQSLWYVLMKIMECPKFLLNSSFSNKIIRCLQQQAGFVSFFYMILFLLFSSLYRIAITFVSLFGTFVLISDLGGQEKMEKRMTTGRSSMKSTIKVVVQRSIHEENVDNLQGRRMV